MENNFKGTKGKWELVREGLQKYIKSGNRYIAEVWFGNEEHNSNAKLIACAPEMLEMLNKVDLLQSKNYGDGMNTHIELIGLAREIRELIKKATEL